MDNKTLYFGSNNARGLVEGRDVVEAYADIVDASMDRHESELQFALIEIIEFQDSGTRRSVSIVFSDLPEPGIAGIIKDHYDIIRALKQEPGMDWSLLAANVVQFGPSIFSWHQPHVSAVGPASVRAEKRWSKPTAITLPGDYRTTEEPDDRRVMDKLATYSQRVSTLLPGRGVLHVLVVPFSVVGPAGDGRKLGAACILIDAEADLPDAALQDLYAKAQLFWLRYCVRPNAGAEVAVAAQ